MPDSVTRFTISVPPELLATFDRVCAQKGYSSRSEAVRDALRDFLVAHEWSGEEAAAGDVVGTITLVYDPELLRHTAEVLARTGPGVRVVAGQHVRLDDECCVEVVIARGGHREIAALADDLISLRGVKHGRLVCTTTGARLP